MMEQKVIHWFMKAEKVFAYNLLFQLPVHDEFTTSWQAYPSH